MGKAYANRKSVGRVSDFYETPYSLTHELVKTNELEGVNTILEPCCGKGAIANVLEGYGFNVVQKDIQKGNDFLKDEYKFGEYDAVVTNPPFSLFDEIVSKAKKVAHLVICIGKTNFLGSHARTLNKTWEHLKSVYVFDRQIDYQFPVQEDGTCGVGCLVSGWFVWDMNYNGKPELNFIDVQKYCTQGSYENYLKKNDYEEYLKLYGKKENINATEI